MKPQNVYEELTDEEVNLALKSIRPIFSKVSTFKQLIGAYILYLQGNIPVTPTYYGQLESDTVAQLDGILKLNRLGFLTIDSQDGLKVDRAWQRAYIIGYMYYDTYALILSVLKTTEIIYGSFLLTDEISSENPRFPIVLGMPDEEVWASIPLTGAGHRDAWELILEFSPKLLDTDVYVKLRYVQFIDPVWGRPGFLVNKLLEALSKK